jgi:hypothetical protein
MKQNTGDEGSGGQAVSKGGRKVEQDMGDINRRSLEIDKYLASQIEVPEVSKLQ